MSVTLMWRTRATPLILDNNWHYATAWNLSVVRRQTVRPSVQRGNEGYKTPKTEIFTEILPKFGTPVHQCSAAYQLRDFHEICRIRTSFQVASTVKISIHLLKSRDYRVMRVLSWGGLVPPKFSASHSGETMRRIPTILEKNVLKVINHRATFGGARISPAARATKNVEFLFVRLSVCSSRFWTSEVVRPLSPWRRWSTETILMTLDKGRGRYVVLVVHQCSNFSDCSQLATLLNAEFQKRQKLGFFRRQRPTE